MKDTDTGNTQKRQVISGFGMLDKVILHLYFPSMFSFRPKFKLILANEPVIRTGGRVKPGPKLKKVNNPQPRFNCHWNLQPFYSQAHEMQMTSK